MKSKVTTLANKLVAQGWSRSMAMIKAWQIVKAGQFESKVSGISLPNRQRATERLARYAPDSIRISLRRDNGNQYDVNAVAVMASVNGSKAYQMGFLPKGLAQYVAPLIDAGKAVTAMFKEIRGKYQAWHNYGLAVSVSI